MVDVGGFFPAFLILFVRFCMQCGRQNNNKMKATGTAAVFFVPGDVEKWHICVGIFPPAEIGMQEGPQAGMPRPGSRMLNQNLLQVYSLYQECLYSAIMKRLSSS